MTRFIHFGCWNNLNTKEKDGQIKEIGCLDNVISRLGYILKTDPPIKFIVVAGDNYYPKKVKTDDGKQKFFLNY